MKLMMFTEFLNNDKVFVHQIIERSRTRSRVRERGWFRRTCHINTYFSARARTSYNDRLTCPPRRGIPNIFSLMLNCSKKKKIINNKNLQYNVPKPYIVHILYGYHVYNAFRYIIPNTTYTVCLILQSTSSK